jgi:mutual gliding-motility protein MglA
MVLFNYATKEITAKVVYYGPGLCGKTTNLQFIYDSLPSNNRSKMLSLATKTDRTLFFDFLPLDLGKIRGMRTKLQLYTVPGQVYYNSTRQLVLKGADGVVFVADSQDFALDANAESLQNLEDNLKKQGLRLREMPLVLQYNKRDLPNALPVEELNEAINKMHVPAFPAVATSGIGVEQTAKGVTQLVLAHLVKKYRLEGSEPLEKEIEMLNVTAGGEEAPSESIWSEEEPPAAPPAPAQGGTVFMVDTTEDDENIPMVSTELVAPAEPVTPSGPFDDLMSYLETTPTPKAPSPAAAPARQVARPAQQSMEVPLGSVEMQLPQGILESLPVLESRPAAAPRPAPASGPQAAPPEGERRVTDGLIKEVSLPLNLSIEELRRHKKLKLRITLDLNLLP